MKNTLKSTLKMTAIALFSLLFTGGGTGITQAKAAPDMGVEVGVDFYNSNLSTYGEWVNGSYGQAWRPYNVSRGWRPYMNGRWMWTDDGWYWSSDEPYGWATYHYGRWTYDDYYGWVWIPGDVWAPAWVEWRYNDDYIGWAPLSPYAEFGFGFGIRYNRNWFAPVHYWNFVSCRNFTSYRVNEYMAPLERSRRFFGSTHGINRMEGVGGRVINQGVDRNFIERHGNVRIERSEMVNGTRGERVTRIDGGHERIEVYRPRIETRSGQRTPDVNGQRNNSEGRSYQEMHGAVRQVPQPDQRQTDQRRVDQGRPEQNRVETPRVQGNQNRQQDNRRTVETPERWRQRMPEQRQAPAARTEPRVQNHGGFSQPQRSSQSAPATRQSAPAARQSAPEGHRGGGRRP